MGEPNVNTISRASFDSAAFDLFEVNNGTDTAAVNNDEAVSAYATASAVTKPQTFGDKYSFWELPTEIAKENFEDSAIALGTIGIGVSVFQPELAPAAAVLAGIGIVGYTGLGFVAGCAMYPFVADQPLPQTV